MSRLFSDMYEWIWSLDIPEKEKLEGAYRLSNIGMEYIDLIIKIDKKEKND